MAEALRADDLVLCSGTLRRSPFEITARAAAAAGFRAISVYHHEYAAARAAGWTDASMRTLLDDLGLGVAEFDGRTRWLPGDDDGAGARCSNSPVARWASNWIATG
jgi:sugar phosphate isomerase/epimerase